MRRTGVCAVVALLVLVGCGPEVAAPSETPVETVEASVEVVTPSLSPSPTWSVVQQGAINAVQRFFDEWSRIAQNLVEAEWDDLHAVADYTAITDAFALWSDWISKGYHLSGSPSFTPTSVILSKNDYRGKTYVIRGCYSIENATLVDLSDQPVGDRGLERSIGIYQVLLANDGTYVVIEASEMDETC